MSGYFDEKSFWKDVEDFDAYSLKEVAEDVLDKAEDLYSLGKQRQGDYFWGLHKRVLKKVRDLQVV